ncbi:MAG TPA: DNA gyrase subunit A [Planctomycetes bacterium]|nr:DNA gyrase subunit A [Planctomycetota bacterium]
MADDPNHPESGAAAGGEVHPVNVQDELRESYMQYAMSVITSRALPDVRDGFKPSQRRVIYAMSQLNLGPGRKRVKSARVVGETMGRYHPHGDSAIYDTLVRMAQDFRSRYLLVDKKGNFGTLSEPSPAAMRYTECRMARAAAEMVADLQYQTVDMRDNYDNTTVEPVVLPSRFPNLLCNGSQGIAVGMATSIPPHNLNEVADALIALIQEPKLSDDQLFQLIPAPDFPTGGVICGLSGVRKAYRTGRGSLTLRGKVEITEKKGKATIEINELPFNVTTETLKEKIQDAYKNKRLEGVSEIKDRSKKDVSLLIVCKKGEDPNVVLNNLYKFTPLQSTFSVIMIALEEHEGRFKPRTFSLRELLDSFIRHRLEVILRRSEYLLERCRARIHILQGLSKALDHIDEVIAIIRGSDSAVLARDELMTKLDVTIRQAKAILDMRLQTLAGLERQKINDELGERRAEAEDLEDIVKRRERRVEMFIEDMESLKKSFGDKRRTEIDLTEAGDLDEEDLIAVEDAVVTVTHQGYIKRTALDEYRVQGRAGKGLYGANTRDDDFVEEIFQASTKDYVLAFTSHGRVHWIKVHRIPEGSRTARGRGIRNIIALLPEEKVTSLIPVKGEFDEDRFLVMATAQGIIKKTVLSAFKRPRKAGVIALKLDEDDHLIGVRITDGERQLVLATRRGKAIRFPEDTVRAMGRSARGVKGINLEDGDRVESLVVVGSDGPYLLTACENGYGKRTAMEEYRETNRSGKGIINIKITPRNGYVVGVVAVKPGDQAMLITTGGKLIRIPVDDVSAIGRSTQGVRIIRVDEGEQVAAVTKVVVEDEDDEDEESEATGGEKPAASAEAEAEAEDEDDEF